MAPVILVPLYIYPSEGAWEPLSDTARANPDVSFLCVVNPGNGPGPSPIPDASYVAALTKLCKLPNVRPLGYVHCSYGVRDPAAVNADIDTYAAWHRESDGRFRVDGIFLDETPYDVKYREAMGAIARYIRAAWQDAGRILLAPSPSSPSPKATGVVVYNPGVVVDRTYFDDADYVVVFEQSRQHWHDYFLNHGLPQIPLEVRCKAVAIVHTCDRSLAMGTANNDGGDDDDDDSIKATRQAIALANQIQRLGFGAIHLTDEVGGGYTSWPAMWSSVAESLQR